ncbi:MAG: adenylate/guanylate cyclase domain-containing protein, partial [Cyclobacteriaceae bacterium]
LNAGDELINVNSLDSALKYTTEAEIIFNKLDSKVGQAYSLGNLGMIYAKLGLDLKAEYHMNKAILILQDLHEYYPIAVYLTYISDIYLEKGEEKLALNYAMLSLELAQKHGMKKQVSDAYLTLSKISELAGKSEEAFMHYKNHITYKDSVNNITLVQQMGDLRTNFEVSKKQIEVDLLNQQKKTQQIIVIAVLIALILICLLAFGLYRRYLFIQKTKLIIEKEKNRSDELLLNILPKETANELKLNGKVAAKKFESVTVLFSDFKAFTQYAEHLSPELLVESVDYYFSRFDQIMEKYELEKIKTIGDAYMCAGGLPFTTHDHAIKMVHAAIEMAQFVEEAKKENSSNQFEVRIGIHTGPVVAGVVGLKKFAYDIWGDTVNIAARMESSSESGRINISENTYQLVKETFECEYRGEIKAKNKGSLKMFYVKINEESSTSKS